MQSIARLDVIVFILVFKAGHRQFTCRWCQNRNLSQLSESQSEALRIHSWQSSYFNDKNCSKFYKQFWTILNGKIPSKMHSNCCFQWQNAIQKASSRPIHSKRERTWKPKRSKNNQKWSKKKFQTSKKIFVFAFAFARCEWTLNDERSFPFYKQTRDYL